MSKMKYTQEQFGNEYKEALNSIMEQTRTEWFDDGDGYFESYDYNVFEPDDERLVKLLELVEKEEPKKLFIEKKHSGFDNLSTGLSGDFVIKRFYCPNCSVLLSEDDDEMYLGCNRCVWCGQKLDWSDKNE